MAKIMHGVVTSVKMQKTVVVQVERVFQHPLYKKTIKKHKKYKAHNESLPLKEGDMVEIREIRPLSKDTHFEVVKIITL
ncbi:MAG TPA: 30S ribosomal protein S17 [Patescibacteria group bacterium]|nr:30S ribosomal protein S17 [Patescibacteria group bacterium]